jgi:hypothetical protein
LLVPSPVLGGHIYCLLGARSCCHIGLLAQTSALCQLCGIVPNIPLQPTVNPLRGLPSAELARYKDKFTT